MKEKVFALIGSISLLLLIVIGLPLAGIWAVNVLFSLGISYTFWNWLAALVLVLITSNTNLSDTS